MIVPTSDIRSRAYPYLNPVAAQHLESGSWGHSPLDLDIMAIAQLPFAPAATTSVEAAVHRLEDDTPLRTFWAAGEAVNLHLAGSNPSLEVLIRVLLECHR